MDIRIHNTPAPDILSVLNNKPEEHIVFRCVDCQTFLMPEELRTITFHIRHEGAMIHVPAVYCPACHPNLIAPKTQDDLVMPSTFLTLNREQVEKSIKAEKSGLVYDLQTDKIQGRLLVS